MAAFDDPVELSSAAPAGRHANAAEHARAIALDDVEGLTGRVVEGAVLRALFPQDATRRAFLKAIGPESGGGDDGDGGDRPPCRPIR
jgi:nitrate/nitrite transport system substrate-binding protein